MPFSSPKPLDLLPCHRIAARTDGFDADWLARRTQGSQNKNGSLREVNGGRKNAGHEPWLAGGSGIGKARHGLQFTRDHCSSIVRRISNHFNPAKSTSDFQITLLFGQIAHADICENVVRSLRGPNALQIFKLL